jgi:hypothetical protein
MPMVFTSIMLFAVVIFFVSIIIGGWLLVAIFRGLARFFVGASNPSVRNDASARPRRVIECDRPQCRNENPGHAQFCRKCGARLKAAQVRRVA